MLNQTAEYALRAMVCMAHEPERIMSAAELSAMTRVPAGYLPKVLQLLAVGELIVGRRGANGGYRLSRDRTEITMLDVINAISPIERITCCPMGTPISAGRLCSLHACLDGAAERLQEVFASMTLDDIVTKRQAEPLCQASRGGGSGQRAAIERP